MDLSHLLQTLLAGLIVCLVAWLAWRGLRSQPGERASSWKFRTVLYIALAITLPLWPDMHRPSVWPILSLALVLMARRSFLAGTPLSHA